MKNLTIAIENLYKVFGNYTSEGMFYCDCGCINPENVKRLLAKPLRDLEEEDMSSYHGSALYTWGDVNHYKHFLPRFLELYARNRWAVIGFWEISRKLEYANWTSWPVEEVLSIKTFFFHDWNEFVNNSDSQISLDDFETYSTFINEKELINFWKIIDSPNGLRNFISLFYSEGNKIINQAENPESNLFQREIYRKIQSPTLLEAIESAFFEFEIKDPEYAEEASVVAQMIEQELKTIERFQG